MASATFPLLSTKEIISSLHEFNLPVQPDDIERPVARQLYPYYFWFINYVCELSESDVSMATTQYVDQKGLDAEGNEILYYNIMWRILNQWLRMTGLDDFSVVDLISPTPARVKRIFSALLNFHLFTIDNAAIINPLDEMLKVNNEDYEKSKQKVARSRDEIAAKKKAINEEQERSRQIEAQNAELRNKLVQLREQEMPVRAAQDEIKRERTILAERVELISTSHRQLNDEILRLRGRIIQSPDRVRRNISDMSVSVNVKKDELAELERKSRHYSSRVSLLKKYEVEFMGMYKVLEEWSADIARTTDSSNKLGNLIDMYEARTETVREAELREDRIDGRIKISDEQMSNYNDHARIKKDASQVRLNKMNEMLKLAESERVRLNAELEHRDKECKELENAIDKLVKSAHDEANKAENAYKELRIEVLLYSDKLNKALDSLNATLLTNSL